MGVTLCEVFILHFPSKIKIFFLIILIYTNDEYVISLATFDNKQAAELAVKELNAKELDGRTVHIRLDRNFTTDFEENENLIPVFVGNLPWSVTSEELSKYFVDFPPISFNLLTNMYGKSRGFAIVNFDNIVEAERAISGVNGIEINGRTVEVIHEIENIL